MLFMCPADAHYRPRPELAPALRSVAGRNQKRSVMMLHQFKDNVLDLWFEGPHRANPHQHDAKAKRNGMTNRDQVMAVVQALEATGTSRTSADPINEVARAFLLSSPQQSALIPPSSTPKTGTLPDSTQNTALGGEARYSTENADSRVEVSIRRRSNSSECDVIVAIRDREMVVRLPDYGRALKWAQMESRSYRLPAGPAEDRADL
jgi:hypothetical protein